LKRRRIVEGAVVRIFFICASVSVISVVFITFFIFQQGLPLFAKVNPFAFLFSP